jgi:hypothetical protein
MLAFVAMFRAGPEPTKPDKVSVMRRLGAGGCIFILLVLSLPMASAAAVPPACGNTWESNLGPEDGEWHDPPAVTTVPCEPCEWQVLKEACNLGETEPDPWVEVFIQFSFSACEGVRERVIDHDVTVTGGGGAVVAGSVGAVFGFLSATWQMKNKGWHWSYTCDLTVDYLYAEGGGGIFREVAVRGTSYGDTRTEASCVYTVVGCTTASIMEGTWAITVSSDGATSGYPSKASAELAAYGVNKPADNEPLCLSHHACIDHPSPGALINGYQARHAPAISRSSTITWTEPGVNVPGIVDGLSDNVRI